MRVCRSSQKLQYGVRSERPNNALERGLGYDKCADCGAFEPDWTSFAIVNYVNDNYKTCPPIGRDSTTHA